MLKLFNMERLYFFAVSLIMLLTGCSSDLKEEVVTGSIVGSVSDRSTGEPISTVNVLLTPGGNSTVTGSDGSFSFENLVPGEYTVEVGKEGYSGNTKSVFARAGEISSAHLLIERLPASITSDKTLLEFGDKVQTLSFTIVNRSYGDLEYIVETGKCEWLSLKPEKGILKYGKTETIVVNLLRDQLPMGRNEAVVVVRSLSGDGNVEVKIVAVNGKSTATLNTLETTDITSTTAVLNGEIVNIGEPKYSERGFVYSDNSEPSISDCIQKLSCPVNDNLNFSCKVENLGTLKTYYARSYLVQNGTVIYGNIISFSTSKQITEVTTSSPTDVGAMTATLHGTVTKVGVPAFTEKGFCYSKYSETPDISDNKCPVPGAVAGNYSLELNGLEYPSIYYVRSYAIQGGGVVYGNVVSFSTAGQSANVSTSAVTDIFASTAVFNGMIQNEGNPPYTERGFCYSRNGKPSISTNKIRVSGSGNGAYSTQVGNLDYPADYSVCSYVIQAGEPVYGNVVNFSTVAKSAKVNTSSVTDITTTSATFNGIISDLGIPIATRRGFCYSAYSSNPVISDNHVDDYVVNTTNFKKNVTGLYQGTVYYVRAYALQDNQYIYGNTVSFTTNREPAVRTDNPSGLKKQETMFAVNWSVTFNGAVLSEGLPAYGTKGFVYGKSSNPDTSNGSVLTVSGSGTGKFSGTVSNLQDMQTYYVRAFVKVGNKYYYGESKSFMTF